MTGQRSEDVTATERDGCMAFLRQQGEVFREERQRRAVLAARLGMTEERLDRLVAASALRPDVGWAP